MRKIDKINLIAKEIQLRDSKRIDTVYFHGYSMKPFLIEGDELTVEPVRWSRIRIGDIVTYRNGDKFPTYRVVRKAGNNLVLGPDNWPKRFKVRREDILGKVTQRHRKGEHLSCHNWRWIASGSYVIIRYVLIALRVRLRSSLGGSVKRVF